MPRILFTAIVFTLLALIACSEPAQTEIAMATAIPQPVATEPAKPTNEEAAATPRPTETATAAPSLTATKAPVPTPTPESTATTTPSPTVTPVPTPTELPAPTPTPSAPAIPTAQPGPATTAQPAPTPIAIREPPFTPGPTPETLTPFWQEITVAPEDRCSTYDSDDYPYPPSVEPRIVAELGGIYGPYTGTWFESIRETDIEHIVARSEAHDSGLCAATAATRRQFASDLLNLTLASPGVNRHQKSDYDAAEWLPALNRCWYVNRVVQVRLEYGLTIDRAEADAIDRVLNDCEATVIVGHQPGGELPAATPTPTSHVDALALYDGNGNGGITCAEARAHGIAPVHRGHPAYEYMRDADGDGIVCE